MAFGQSNDFASEIADLMQKAIAAGSQDAQEALVALHKRAQDGDERVANLLKDGASRIRESRNVIVDEPTENTIGRVAELMDPDAFAETKRRTPNEREEKLLKIIKTQNAALKGMATPVSGDGGSAT